MHLWIAVKHAPLHLARDPVTHVTSWRFDRCWLWPEILRHRYAYHVELVVTHPCVRDCDVCRGLPSQAASDRFNNNKHYVTYTVNDEFKKVTRSTKRHIIAPPSPPENDEDWTYYRMPMKPNVVRDAFHFLESQLGKPIRNSSLNFYCLCRSKGLHLDDPDFAANDAWSCSELASAVLILYCSEYADTNIRHPCLTSPCSLESQVRDVPSVHECDQILFRAVVEVTIGR
jgi:hypothetical protein